MVKKQTKASQGRDILTGVQSRVQQGLNAGPDQESFLTFKTQRIPHKTAIIFAALVGFAYSKGSIGGAAPGIPISTPIDCPTPVGVVLQALLDEALSEGDKERIKVASNDPGLNRIINTYFKLSK